ncbi:O-antigen ligase family protein [Patescibacteria group bacterium]|nr:O-antigen ligase family protein [Patescibacteria group bacterium]
MNIKIANKFEFSIKEFVLLIVLTVPLGISVSIAGEWTDPLMVLGGIIGVVISIFIFRNPVLGIFLIAFLLPFERIGAIEAAGMTIRISQILTIVTIGGWIFDGLRKQSFFLRKNPLIFPLALFVVVNVASLLNAENIERSASVLLFTLFTIVFSLLIPQLVNRESHVKIIIRLVVISAFIVGVFGIFQFLGDIIGLPQSITGLRDLYTKEVLGFPRIQSTALEPLYFANYLLIPLGLLCTLFLGKSKNIRYSYLIFLIIFLGLNLVLTVSRGGYLGFVVILVVLGIYYFKRIFTSRKTPILLVSAVIIAYFAVRLLGLGNTVNLEIFKGHVVNAFYGAAYSERVETLEIAMDGYYQHPWIGVGVGGFGPYASVHPYVEPSDGWNIVNNESIELLAEVGILGLLSFIVMFAIVIFRSIKAIQVTKDSYLRAIMIGFLAVFIGIFAQYQTFSTLYIMHVWFVIGMMVAVQNIIFKKS